MTTTAVTASRGAAAGRTRTSAFPAGRVTASAVMVA